MTVDVTGIWRGSTRAKSQWVRENRWREALWELRGTHRRYRGWRCVAPQRLERSCGGRGDGQRGRDGRSSVVSWVVVAQSLSDVSLHPLPLARPLGEGQDPVMDRRRFLAGTAAVLLAAPLAAEAQPGGDDLPDRVPRRRFCPWVRSPRGGITPRTSRPRIRRREEHHDRVSVGRG